MTPSALLRDVLSRRRRGLAGATALLVVWQCCEALVPVLIGVIIDRAVDGGSVTTLLLWSAVLCVHFAVLSSGYRFGSRIAVAAEQYEAHRLRTSVSAHVLDPRGARTTQLPGDLLSVATSDADLVVVVVREVAFTVAALLGLVLTGVVLVTIDPLLSVLVLVGVPVVLGVTQLLSRPLSARSEVRQEAVGRAVGLASDLVQGLRPLAGIGAQDHAIARYREQSRQAADASVRAARWEGVVYGVTQGLSGLFLAVVALVAGTRAVQGSLSIGELVAVVGLAQFVAEPIRLLAYLVADLARSRASAARICAVLASPPLVVSGEERLGDRIGLTADDVHHASLGGLGFEVRPGELVALAAEDPADAVALMTLLHGEAVPERGRLLLGDRRLTELHLADVRGVLLVADHHVDLFEGDLRSNLDATGQLDDDRLADVLAASAADDVAAHSADGLAAAVGVAGSTLSGGQRQRLGLARALAADPPLLVLHDPTTAVDAVTEARIADGLARLRRGDRGTLVLTSSPALLAAADRVVHVRDGVVVAAGTHASLSADPGYRAAVLR